ncbi:hypothetical protein ACQ4PT_061397 [Festuca glaucescens]
MDKCSANLIRCTDADVAVVDQELHCPVVPFPLRYLGLPLTLRKPSAAQLQYLVDSVANKLPGWRASLLDRGGRLELVRATLSAMPIFAMMSLDLPVKTLLAIEKIIRGFLWKGRKDVKGGHCLVAWNKVCAPKEWGGLGIPNLRMMNVALRARWLWLQRVDDSKPWKELNIQVPKMARQLFEGATYSVLGDGASTFFWTDKWLSDGRMCDVAPNLFAAVPKQAPRQRLVHDGLTGGWLDDIPPDLGALAIRELLQVADRLVDVTLTEGVTHIGSAYSQMSNYLHMPCNESTMLDDDSSDWLHKNGAYMRKVSTSSGLHGQDNFVTKSSYSEKKRQRDCSEETRQRHRERYSLMPDGQRNARLQKNRSPDTNSDEDADPSGIFEPTEQDAVFADNLDTMQEEEETMQDDDEECRIFSGLGDVFDSYRVATDVPQKNPNTGSKDEDTDTNPESINAIQEKALHENINDGVNEQALPTRKPQNHELEDEIIREGQTDMQIEEGLTKSETNELENKTGKEATYSELTNELSVNKASQQLLSAQDKHLATTSGTEGPGTMENELALPMQIEKHMRRHNKPKKTHDYVVSPEDYACTGDDWSVIDKIRNEPSDKRYLVSIDDGYLKKAELLSLLTPGEFIGDEIINAYINCISGTEHLQVTSGGSVFLENACVSKTIKSFSCVGPDDAPTWLLDRVRTYFKYDMLEGLENLFKYASLNMELKTDKWPDLNVTTWPREECITSSLQTDGSSCGLWMLNFMEYFTGDILSDIPEQVNMTDFRRKLAVILVDSHLNDDNIRNRDLKDDEDHTFDPTDCVIVDGPPKNIKTSKLSSEIGFISQSLLLSPSVNPTDEDLIDELCLYISTVHDVPSLETEWVRSSSPYPISLNLRQISNILKMNENMDVSCFNMAVRILASHDIQLARDVPVHYMDLKFCLMTHYARDPSRSDNLGVARLAQLFLSWPDSNEYHISECNMILLPWDIVGLFQLFVLDRNKKVISFLDPLPIPYLGKTILKNVANNFNLALKVANPASKDDITTWGCKVPKVPTNSDDALSGYLVFEFMHSWYDGLLYFPVPTDGFQLRKRCLVHILKYEANEALSNIPAIARSLIDRIKKWTFKIEPSSANK